MQTALSVEEQHRHAALLRASRAQADSTSGNLIALYRVLAKQKRDFRKLAKNKNQYQVVKASVLGIFGQLYPYFYFIFFTFFIKCDQIKTVRPLRTSPPPRYPGSCTW